MAETPLQGQVSIVTGASQGIGQAVALRLAELGSAVVVAARNQAGLEAVAHEIEQSGGRALAVRTDVRSPESVSKLAAAALRSLGRIDILVNNAGIGYFGSPLHEMPPEAFAATMETNVGAVYFAIRAVAPHMIERRRGHIINIASLAGHNPLAGGAAYAASKAALHGLSVSAAEELRGYGIRVSLVCPGSVDTDLSPDLVGRKDRGKMLRPDDIAHVVTMLATQTPQSFVSEVLIRPTLKP